MNRLLTACLLALCISSQTTASENRFSVLSQNMNRLFDDVDDGAGRTESRPVYRERLRLAAIKLVEHFDSPDIIALQEVENLRVLKDLAKRIKASGGPQYRAILLEGNDISGIDVGYLLHPDLKISRTGQLFKDDRLALDNSALFSRPPLMVEVCKQTCLTLVNIHLRSMRDLGSARKGRRVAMKRRAQAETLAAWIEYLQTHIPQSPVLILGDFNALQPADGYTDIVGIIKGMPDNSDALYPGKDLITEDLVDLGLRIPEEHRYSYIYRGKKQRLDYMLSSRQLVEKLKVIRFGDVDEKFSDHRVLLAEFDW